MTDDLYLKREKHAREDGWLCELISSEYTDEPFTGIHSYLVSVAPDKSRANHYHKRKEEWIAVASGKIILSLIWTLEERREDIILDSESEKCRIIHIKPYVAHKIKNIYDRNSSVIVFSKTPEDKEDTIPYAI